MGNRKRQSDDQKTRPRHLGRHLLADPRICRGKPFFKGTRVPVEKVLVELARARTFQEILAARPKLTRAAVAEAIQLAAAALVKPYASHNAAVRELWKAGRQDEVRLLRPWEVGQYLIVDPGVCFGKLTFKGTRLPVQTILTYLSMRGTMTYILKGWPYLKREALVEAIQLAKGALIKQCTNQTEDIHEPVLAG